MTVKDLKNDAIDFSNCSKISTEDYNNLRDNDCNPLRNDVLFSKDGTVGKVALVNYDLQFVVLSSLAILRPHPTAILSNYLFHILKSSQFLLQALKRKKGVAIRRIILRDLKEIGLNLPPVPEQHRIVAKIEELFSELDKGVEALKTAQQQLKVYRQAVLQRAFEGKLTEEWRKQQKDLPTASQLLGQIRTERESHAQVTVSTLKLTKPLTKADLAELPLLPPGWCWIRLGQLAQLITKGASPKWQGFNYVNDKSQLLFITSENVRECYLDLSEPKYLEIAFNDIQKRSELKLGDILFNIVGASIGRAVVFSLDKKSNINQAVSLIRLLAAAIQNDYLVHYLNSAQLKEYYNNRIVDVARANLSLDDVSKFPIPLCTIQEQQQIVQEIESRLSVADKIEESINQSLRQAETLRQSILKKAFSGKLVPQDPNDEPAEKLLARIRAEKAVKTSVSADIRRKKPTRRQKQQ